MNEIFLEVRGGVLQEVYSDQKDLRICFLDWDAGDRPGDACSGGVMTACVLSQMPGDTAAAFAFLGASRADCADAGSRTRPQKAY